MLFLQAATDDSGSESGDRRLFMGGYLHTAEEWAKFAVAWDKALRAKPSIDYLKMSEANNLSAGGQFCGWPERARDKKLANLAAVINRFEPFAYYVSLSRVAFDRLLKPHAPYGLSKPHFTCVYAVASSVVRQLEQFGVFDDAKVNFIFDRQDEVSTDIRFMFDYMIEKLPDKARAMIGDTPHFQDDRAFVPLQAADMLVWHLRREHEQQGKPLPLASELRGRAWSGINIGAEVLARWGKEFAQVPGVAMAKTKSEWKAAMRDAAEMKQAGFKPPHGHWFEIYKAVVAHKENNTAISSAKKK